MKDGRKKITGLEGLRKWLKWLWSFGSVAADNRSGPNNPDLPKTFKEEVAERIEHQEKLKKSFTRDSKILMIGWELPPHNSGGLGVACYELCESLARDCKAKITFVLPYNAKIDAPFMKMKYCNAADFDKFTKKTASPYPDHAVSKKAADKLENDLLSQVQKYAEQIGEAVKGEEFDVIHAHDWLSFAAGIMAKKITGKPLVVHVHSTEFDRAGGDFVYQKIADIEKKGMEEADEIIAVSDFTKSKIIKHYGINPEKIKVVHNGISYRKNEVSSSDVSALKRAGKKIVLFVGRITIQKGPDYFLEAASKVAKIVDEAVFIVVGAGDMERQIIEKAAELGLSDKVFFTGFVSGQEKNSLYRSADLYVMPSVSEPFGIVALESMVNRTPILISKQSGVSETVKHALKVDFWDTDEMANKIAAVLRYKSLRSTLGKKGFKEAQEVTWKNAAERCVGIYNNLLNND